MKPTFAVDKHGREITRDRKCECGRMFTQRLLSPGFLEVVEAYSKGALAAITKQIPGYFVPVHCPPCERRDLGMQARMDEHRAVPAHYDSAAD